MALGNDSNPIIKDSEPRIKTSKWGTLRRRERAPRRRSKDVYSGGDATRGGSTAINAAGDGKAAAEQIAKEMPFTRGRDQGPGRPGGATTPPRRRPRTRSSSVATSPQGIVEITVKAPMVAKSAQAGQFVRVLPNPKGELIPLTLADWDAKAGTIDAGHPGRGRKLHPDQPDAARRGLRRHRRAARPALQAAPIRRQEQTVVFCAGGVGLPPVYPIAREHLRLGNHVTLIAGYPHRERAVLDRRRRARRQAQGGVRRPARRDLLHQRRHLRRQGLRHDAAAGDAGRGQDVGKGRKVAEVIAIGPPLMMQAVSRADEEVRAMPTVVSLNSIMVDATGMCGACMVPVDDRRQDGAQARLHRRAGARRPHHRLGQVPAALQSVQGAGTAEPRPSRPRLRLTTLASERGVRPKGRPPLSFPTAPRLVPRRRSKTQIPRGAPAGLAKPRDFRRDQAAVMRSSAGEGSRST